jgi:hypothetical protein
MRKEICNEDYVQGLMNKTAKAIFELNAYYINNGKLPWVGYDYEGASRARAKRLIVELRQELNEISKKL